MGQAANSLCYIFDIRSGRGEMQINSAIRERDRQDENRIFSALQNPKRRAFGDPLDPKLECVLGRLRSAGRVTEAEYLAGVNWRELYFGYMTSIGAPYPFCQSTGDGDLVTGDAPLLADEICENLARAYKAGTKLLESKGRRVRDAVNSLCVYDDPEELGDFEYTLQAARIGLAELSRRM